MVNAWREQHIRDQRSPKRQDAGGKTRRDCPLKTSDGFRQTSSGECTVFDDLFNCRGSPESFRGCNSAIHARDTRAATVRQAARLPLQYGSFATPNLRNLRLEISSPSLLGSRMTQKRTSSRR